MPTKKPKSKVKKPSPKKPRSKVKEKEGNYEVEMRIKL